MSSRNKEKIKARKIYSYTLVAAQLIAIIALALQSRSSIIEGLLSINALIIGLWSVWHLRKQLSALPEPIKGKKLIQSGPYRFVRHPIYFAVLLWGLGKVISNPWGLPLVIYFLLFGILLFKINHEEELLMEQYVDYKKYKVKTAGLVPFLI